MQTAKFLCKPAKWTDLATFYLGNYFAHAVTVRSTPGQSFWLGVLTMLYALLYPISGLYAGARAISSAAVLGKTPLQTAARARALLMVVNEDKSLDSPGTPSSTGENQDGDIELGPVNAVGAGHGQVAQTDAAQRVTLPDTFANLTGKPKTETYRRSIHGRIALPTGWKLVTVPRQATFANDDPKTFTSFRERIEDLFSRGDVRDTQLSLGYNLLKAGIALVQAIYAIATLYDTSGDQIEHFGYAAFGFTVAPYTAMSLVNFIGNIMCPEYAALYVVENDTLRDLRKLIVDDGKDNQFYVEGTVGRLEPDLNEEEPGPSTEERLWIGYDIFILIAFVIAAIHIAIIGGLSHFHHAYSSPAQRKWMMVWLAVGDFIGFVLGYGLMINDELSGYLGLGVFLAALPVGGFVVVGQMIQQHQICKKI